MNDELGEGKRERMIIRVSQLLHKGEFIQAGQHAADFSTAPGTKPPVVLDVSEAQEICWFVLRWCLDNNRYDLAAGMLWNETLFTYQPRCTQMVWKEIQNSFALMLMGAGSMSKSYGAGVWLLLDWLRDPQYTNVKVVGPSEQHLKDNLFSHLVTFHRSATLPLPGETRDLFIGLDPKERKSAISGVVIPVGQKGRGRLQGTKRIRRKNPHPKFGILSRLRIMVDEFEKVPPGIHKDIDNLFSNFDGEIEGLKIITAFNPEDIAGPAAVRCEPKTGWNEFKPDTDEVWDSKRGWRVLRLDAAKCENVMLKRTVFPGLQTWEGFNQIIANAGGTDTPPYWTMARACFPPAGAVFSIMPPSQTSKLIGEFIFGEAPIAVGAADIALEGGDIPTVAIGRFGKAIGYKLPPSLEFPAGKEILFFDKQKRRVLRWALQVDEIIPLPPGDTVTVALAIKEVAGKFSIKPQHFIVDRTGNGAGVHDVLLKLWLPADCRGVNYTEGATEMKILEEDTDIPVKEFERVVHELWFALKRWTEHNYIKISPKALTEAVLKELNGRRYQDGKNNKVETKRDYKSRGNNSPDKADAITLLLHIVRLAFSISPSALDGVAGTTIIGRFTNQDPVPCRIDHSNRFEDLDTPGEGSDSREAYGDTFLYNE